MELRLSNLTKRYGDVTALDDFSVTFDVGITGILGANGAGKSTMMSLITDNVKRDSGSITLDGKEILEMGADFRSLVGYMPQQQGVYDKMTALSFVSYIGRLKGLKGKALKEETERVLEITNLSHVRNKAVGGFSGGMRQRVLLAQAVLGDPKILILDEPTAGLDPKERIRIRNFISELARDRIVLLCTHIVSDIESVADKVLLMKKGKLLMCDSPAGLIESLPDDYVPVNHYPSLEDVYLYYLGGE
ncbi:MAG: ATP-binding cassette domain-containing protein [Oscillospiraceae bacterium]|nr:ATP-binding cassette domain-containing protein [Oscillospiraceae bacterium]